MASVAVAAHEIPRALDLLNKAVKTLAESRNPDRTGARSKTELGHVYAGYGQAYAAAGNNLEARAWYTRAQQLFSDLRAAGKLDSNGADLFRHVEMQLGKLGKPR